MKTIEKIILAGVEYAISDSTVPERVTEELKELGVNTYTKNEIDEIIGDIESILNKING